MLAYMEAGLHLGYLEHLYGVVSSIHACLEVHLQHYTSGANFCLRPLHLAPADVFLLLGLDDDTVLKSLAFANALSFPVEEFVARVES